MTEPTPPSAGASAGTGAAPPPRPGLALRIVKRAWKPVVSAALLGVLGWTFDWDKLAALPARARWDLIVYSILALLPFLLLKTLRWHLLVRWVKREAGAGPPAVRFGDALRSVLGGMGLGVVTPGRLGEIARLYLLPWSGSRKPLWALALYESLTDVCVLVAVGGVGVGFYFSPLGFLACPAGLLLLAAPFAIPALRGALSLRSALVCAGLTLALTAVRVGQNLLLVAAFGPAPGAGAALLFPAISAIALLPITVDGLGLREWSAALLLGPVGVAREVAAGSFFVSFLILHVAPAIAGLLLFARGKRREIEALGPKAMEAPGR